jgi:hypothetical protein
MKASSNTAVFNTTDGRVALYTSNMLNVTYQESVKRLSESVSPIVPLFGALNFKIVLLTR